MLEWLEVRLAVRYYNNNNVALCSSKTQFNCYYYVLYPRVAEIPEVNVLLLLLLLLLLTLVRTTPDSTA